MSLPKYFPQNNMFRSTCVGIFQGVFFRKILHSCREMPQFSGPHLYIIYILKGGPIYFSQQTAPTHLCLCAANLRATPKNIYNMPTQKYNQSYTNYYGFSSNFHTNSRVEAANFVWVIHNTIEPIHSPDLA
jgi:hypothetical protein